MTPSGSRSVTGHPGVEGTLSAACTDTPMSAARSPLQHRSTLVSHFLSGSEGAHSARDVGPLMRGGAELPMLVV